MTAADPSAYAAAIEAALLSDPSVGIPARVDPVLAAWVRTTAVGLAELAPALGDAAEARVVAHAKATADLARTAPVMVTPLSADGTPAGPARVVTAAERAAGMTADEFDGWEREVQR